MMRKKLALYGIAVGLTISSLIGCSKTVAAEPETTVAETVANESQTEVATEPATEAEETEEKEIGPGVPDQIEPTMIWGQITNISEEDGRITMDGHSSSSYNGEIILNISEETKVLDAVEAMPVNWTELSEGDMIYTYVGPAMTMSLPPMTNAELILCKIPMDYKVPALVKVNAMEMQEDRSYLLTAVGGTEYTVPEDCPIQPYLVKMMVYLEHVQEGDTCLVWTDADNQVSKIVLFSK